MKKLFLSLTVIIFFTAVNAQTDSLQQYAGKYVFPDGSVIPGVEVTLVDGGLMMSSSAGVSALTKIGIDSFEIVEFRGLAVFKRNGDQAVNGIHIDAAGYILDGTKQANGIWIFREYYRSSDKMNIRKEE